MCHKKGVKQLGKAEWEISINIAKGATVISREVGSCFECMLISTFRLLKHLFALVCRKSKISCFTEVTV